jgi:hypothetical protein
MSVTVGPRFYNNPSNPLWGGLLAYYTADSTPNDATGNGYDGTLVNGATYGSGIINQGFSLDGVNDYISISPTLGTSFSSPTSPHSYSAWIYKTGSSQRFIIQNGKNDMGTSMVVTSGGNLGLFYRGGFSVVASSGFITLNSWIHCVVTYDGSGNVEFYTNGVSAGSGSISWTDGIGTCNTYIGTYLGTSNYFNGEIDEVGVWDRVLTSTEVTELYNGGLGLQYTN